MNSQIGLFDRDRRLDEVAVTPVIEAAARSGAWFVFNLSGGKDSGALSLAAMLYLDALGHPRERRLAIHADLGRAEWKSTPITVEQVAAKLGLPLHVVRRSAGDLVARWQNRFDHGKRRYVELATYNLIGPWSQANKRFCTSELKAQVIGPYLARLLAGQSIVQIIGIRRDESSGRSRAPIAKLDLRYASAGNSKGTSMMLWHPGVDWTSDEIFDCHKRHDLPLHEAYTAYGSTRLSCAFCVLASIHDLQAAASAADNVDLYLHLVGMEADSTFSFQPERWLADVAPSLLSAGLAADVARAKLKGQHRKLIEEGMPAGLRYVSGWPVRAPDQSEAEAIAGARRQILDQHGLEDRFPSGPLVIARFRELLDRQAEKLAA